MPNTAVEVAAKRLNTWFAEKKITYAALAEETGLSVSTLHSYFHKPPLSSRSDALDRILYFLGHTREELFEGIPKTALSAAQQLEILTEENTRLKSELDSERELQQRLSKDLEKTREQFTKESKKNDELLGLYRNSAADAIKERDKAAAARDKEHMKNVVLWVLLFVVSALMIVFFMYSFYAFFAFDVKDLTRGIWPFPRIR